MIAILALAFAAGLALFLDHSKSSCEVPMYVISLKRRPERLQNFCAQFDSTKKPRIYWVEAVDGAGLDTSNNQNQKLTRGEIACFLSHLKALKEFVRNGDDRAVIAEDDAVFLCDPALIPLENKRSVSLGNNTASTKYVPGATQNLILKSQKDLYGAHAILYTREDAVRILKEFDGHIQKPWDFFIAKYVLVADPALAVPRDLGDTDTQRTR